MTTKETDSEADAAVNRRGVDLAFGGVLCALALFALLWLIPNHTQPADSQFDVAPGFFPQVAASAVLGLSLLMIAHRLLRMEARERSGFRPLVELICWSIVAVILYLLLTWLGFVPMAMVAIALGMVLSGARTWWLIALVSVAFPVLVDWGAWLVFSVDMP